MNILAQQPLNQNNNNNNNPVNNLTISSIYEYLAELMGLLSNQNDIKAIQEFSNTIEQISNISNVILKSYCDENGNVHVPNGNNNEALGQIKQHYSTLSTLSSSVYSGSSSIVTILQINSKNPTVENIALRFSADLPLLTSEIQNSLSFLLTIESMYRAAAN